MHGTGLRLTKTLPGKIEYLSRSRGDADRKTKAHADPALPGARVLRSSRPFGPTS